MNVLPRTRCCQTAPLDLFPPNLLTSTSLLVQGDGLSSLELPKAFLPQFILFTEEIQQICPVHARLVAALHGLELRNHVPEPKRLADALGRAGLHHDVHDVDVEVVVRRLVVDVALQLVGIDLAREDVDRGVEDPVAHRLQPGDVFLAQVAEGPDVAPLDERQEMHPLHGLAVPVQVRKQQEARRGGRVRARVPVHAGDDVFLLGAPVQDVEDPVQPARRALARNVRPHVLRVDPRCLAHHPHPLRRVFPDMLCRARVDEVEFEVRERGC